MDWRTIGVQVLAFGLSLFPVRQFHFSTSEEISLRATKQKRVLDRLLY